MSLTRKNLRYLLVFGFAIMFAGSASAQMIQGTDSGLGGANSITGTVLTPNGQRFDRPVSVRLSTSTRGDRVAMTDGSGNFAFRGLVNGDYTIAIDKEKEYENFSQTVNVFQMRGAPGQTYPMNLRLKFKPGVTPRPGVINSALADVPPAALAFYKKGLELANGGDAKGAIEQLKLAIAEHPKFALAYSDMGAQYLKLNDPGRADDAFKTALNLEPTLFPALLNHGIVMFDIKKYAEAETIFREVVKAKDDSAAGHFFLGQSLAYLGKFSDAQKELTHALTLGGEPMAASLKEAHRLLAIIYSTQGDKKRQAAELETYLKLAPNAPDAEQLRKVIAQLKG